ncbi:MAG TPA: glutaminyl-peptide cyclotransferase [Pyrinomonadaceae bacterium]|jgi:glutamine cyclotransferase
MRRLSLGALSLAVISPFLACGESGPGAISRETVQAKSAQTVNSRAASSVSHRQDEAAPGTSDIPVYTYEVVNTWPHDPKAFTQGLAFHDGHLYESTGHHGTSTLRRVELKTGKVKKKYNVPTEYFAEGIAILQDKIYQLTWQSHKCFIYDLKSFKVEGEFHHGGEGWGLTHDGKLLIMSDGTSQLRFLDPNTFLPVRTISVLDGAQPLMDINELEYIKGEIYANIWHSERIVRIDPANGKILGWIDLSGLRPPDVENDTDNVLNGIAYDEKEDRLFVTGKRWPKLFEIRLKRK